MQRKISKAEKALSLMYKRSMLADLNYNTIRDSLWDMSEACGDIHWAFDDDDTLFNFFDGNGDEAYEFKFSFSDLDAEIERLQSSFEEIFGFSDDPEKDFNDVTVALLGDWFKLLGYDSFREDYFEFEYIYENEAAKDEAEKRLMRKTKKEILDNIGLVMSFVLRYFDLKTRYDYLKATIDIFRDENSAVIKLIKSIDEKYRGLFNNCDGNLCNYVAASKKAIDDFDKMVNSLPDRYWVE